MDRLLKVLSVNVGMLAEEEFDSPLGTGGGGQPIFDGCELAEDRGQVLYDLDKANKLRFSHENPEVAALYKDYLEKPLSHKAHELLHTDQTAWKL